MPALDAPPVPRRRIRVLMAVHGAGRGGAELVALGQARALRNEYDVVVAVGKGPLRPAFEMAADAIVRGPPNLPIWGAPRARWALQIGRAIPDSIRFAALVRKYRIDVIVVNSTVLVAPVIGARLAGVPVIVHAQEAPKSRAARRLFVLHGVLANTVVAISPWIARAFKHAHAHVLANPVGIAVPPDPGPRELSAGAPLRLVVVGRVDRHKRQDLAIAAVRALRDQGIDAELTLLGLDNDPGYAAELREQARALDVERQIIFAGPTSDVASRLLAADALLLPAGEVTPLVIMEAMALRTPVIAARRGAIPDVITDGVSGLLVVPDDADALAATVARLRRETGLAQRIAEQGRRRVQEEFDETTSHCRLSAEIRRLTSDAPRARSRPEAALRRELGPAWRRGRAAVLRWRLRVSSARVAGALVYHETLRTPPSVEQVMPAITEVALERHLRHLRRSYKLVAPSQVHQAMLARRRGGRIPVAVTFDDDLASHLEVAAPLLTRLGCPAGFNLTGAGLDGAHCFWWQHLQAAANRGLDPRPALRSVGLHAAVDDPLSAVAEEVERSQSVRGAAAQALAELVGEDPDHYRVTRSQVSRLARAGFEIGFHTLDHRPLTELADGDLGHALCDGRDALERATGRAVSTIAYPHGRADHRVVAAARAARYADGFGGQSQCITERSDRLLLPRLELLLEDPGAFELAMARSLRLGDRQPIRNGTAEFNGAGRVAQTNGAQR